MSSNKEDIANELIQQYRSSLPQNKSITPADKEDVGCNDSTHVLLENKPDKNGNPKSVTCKLCYTLDSTRRHWTKYSCTECQTGFHVNCFAAYHFKDLMKTKKRVLYNILYETNHSTRKRHKKSKYAPEIKDLKIPALEHTSDD